MINLISNLTGIKKSVLEEAQEKNGLLFILEHPNALKVTKIQKAKLNSLKDLIQKIKEVEFVKENICLTSSRKSGEYFVSMLSLEKSKEKFLVCALDSQNNIINTEIMFSGSISETQVYPREIVKFAINNDAKNIIVSHNHPGGSLSPSNNDIQCTKRISEALKSVDIKLLDHIIVADDMYTSLAEKGYMEV